MMQDMVDYLVAWIKGRVAEGGAKGIVIGISGGIDSALAGALAKKAFPDESLGLIMPCHSSPADVDDAVKLANTIGLRYHIIPLNRSYDDYIGLMRRYPETALTADRERMTQANIKPRLRMTTLYYMAGMLNYLVLGTSNKCEIAVGYATKWGDNAVDLQVLGDLYKSEIFEMARMLKLPDEIINKPPSAGLWEGQTDENEMGFTYEALENYLKTGEGDKHVVARIQHMNALSEHKRLSPPVPMLDVVRSR